MDTIQVHDKIFKPYITANEIDAAIEKLATELEHDYAHASPLFIAILNGSFIFAADLFKRLNFPAEICFIKLASYKGTKSSGQVITSIGLDADVFGRDVVILEDIIDTGKTLSQFLPQLEHQQPKSLRICALLHKKETTVYPIDISYLGFVIPDRFVVGYGLDYDGYGRNYGEIYQLVEE
jgi:hypoxanthine phosphoribosyltransferase